MNVNGVLRLKNKVFEKVRSDEDFAAMVRVGRLINVLAYMADLHVSGPIIDEKNPISLRTFTRTLFNAAGYIYEGYELIESLYPKYYSEPYFSQFAAIYQDQNKSANKKMMKLMRNAGAFHLDSDNKSTKAALSRLNLKEIDLISGNDGTYSSLYFHLADTLDINYVIDQLKTSPDDDERTIYLSINSRSAELMGTLIKAADQFTHGIAVKLNLAT